MTTRRSFLAGIGATIALIALPFKTKAVAKAYIPPPNRCKGFQIFDQYGNHICDLAEDILPMSMVQLKQFTNWSIPIPKPLEGVHPAIRVAMAIS